MTTTAVFKSEDGKWNLVQVATKRNDTITDTIDALIRMGFSAGCQWDYTLTLFGDKQARRLGRDQMVTKASGVETARKATAEFNGWTRANADLDGRTVRCVICQGPVFDCPLEDAEDAICRDCGLDRLTQMEA